MWIFGGEVDVSSPKNCEPKIVYAGITSQYDRSSVKVTNLELTPTVATGRRINVTDEIVSIVKLSCSMILLSCCTTRLKDYIAEKQTLSVFI